MMETDTDCPRVNFYLSRLSLEEIEKLRQMLVHRLEHAPALAAWLGGATGEELQRRKWLQGGGDVIGPFQPALPLDWSDDELGRALVVTDCMAKSLSPDPDGWSVVGADELAVLLVEVRSALLSFAACRLESDRVML